MDSVQPKFKVGDKIKNKDPDFGGTALITKIENGFYFYKSIDSKYSDPGEYDWKIERCDEQCYVLTKLHKALI